MNKVRFAVGDLVTGIDRSYTRSIYRFVRDIDGNERLFDIVAYKGKTKFNNSKPYVRSYSEFRSASAFEIKKATSNAHVQLIYFLSRLGIKCATELFAIERGGI